MNVPQFATVMRARKRLALTVFFSIIGLSVIGSLLWPNHYRGDASVVVNLKPDPVSGIVPMLQAPTIIATQLDIINSDRVARRVVRSLKLDQSPEVRQNWMDETNGKVSIVNWLAELLQKHLDAKPSRESNVITISYTAPNPEFAATVANAFMQAYLDTLQELRVDPARQNAAFFDQRSKDARAAVEKAQAALSEYQRSTGITGSDERLDVETARLNELANQLVVMQTLASDANSRQTQARNGKGDELSETLNNPVIANLKIELGRAEANLQELNQRLGSAHPQVQQARANIAELRSRLDAETRRVTSGVTVSANINQARVAQAQHDLEEQRTRVLKLKQDRDRVTVLQQDVENAQKVLDAIVVRQSQSSLESQSQQGDVSVLSPADVPIKPSSPIMLLNVLIAVFLGGILATVAALQRENADRRVRAPQDLADLLGLPVLGVLPRPVGRKTGPLSLMAQRVISGRLPAPGRQ